MTGAEAVAKLADSVRVGCYDFRIEKWDSHAANASRRYGEFSSIEQVIRIDRNLISRIKAVDTFLHEVSHAIYWTYGIDDSDKEERVCGTLGIAWTQVYRDNRWLPFWIAEVLCD